MQNIKFHISYLNSQYSVFYARVEEINSGNSSNLLFIYIKAKN